MEYHRKQAKALVRAHRAGEPEAVARAERVLGDRARQRFLLSDAQHVASLVLRVAERSADVYQELLELDE